MEENTDLNEEQEEERSWIPGGPVSRIKTWELFLHERKQYMLITPTSKNILVAKQG